MELNNHKTHYTATELAGLPGMPTTDRRVRSKAETEQWGSRPIKKKDGSASKFQEYAFTSLPSETQKHLVRIFAEATTPAPAEPKPQTHLVFAPKPPEKLTDKQRACMEARLAFIRFIQASPANTTQTIDWLVKSSRTATLPEHLQALVAIANAKPGKSRKLSTRSLWKWWSDSDAGQTCTTLAPKVKEHRIEPTWAKHLMKCWAKPQKPKLTEVLEDLATEIPAGVKLPSYDQARNYLKTLGAIELNKGRMSGSELATLKPYRRRLTDHMYPGDAYTADGHTFDGEVAHPFHGRPFRPEITPVLDVATRMVVGWSCDLAESGLAVLDALRGACENFGPCVIFYTDNGKGYKNQMMVAPGIGILSRLQIHPEYSRPRNPQAHGVSERAHQTILIKVARSLCTYIGKSMDGDAKRLAYKETRKAIRTGEQSALLIEWEDFIELVNRAIAEYNNRPHSGLPAYRDPVTRKRVHYSPAQYWQLLMEKMKRDLPPDHWTQPANELPDLYHPAQERTVDRGWIHLTKQANGLDKMYYAPELKNWHGERVMVAFSPSDPSKVWVRELAQGRLIAVAKLNGNADPYFAQSLLEEKREQRADNRRKRLERQLEEIELERKGPGAVVIEHSPEILAKAAPLEQSRNAPEVIEVKPIFSIPPTQGGKYQYWCRIDAQIRAGEEVGEDERRFHTGFQKTAAWESERMFDQSAMPLQAEM